MKHPVSRLFLSLVWLFGCDAASELGVDVAVLARDALIPDAANLPRDGGGEPDVQGAYDAGAPIPDGAVPADGAADVGSALDAATAVDAGGGPVCGDGRRDEAEDCDDGNTDDGDRCPSSCLLELPRRQLVFEPLATQYSAPERGYYRTVGLDDPPDFEALHADGLTLAFMPIDLDAYRQAPIDRPMLRRIEGALSQAAEAGVKVIPRFRYGPSGEDSTLERVLEHIAQLRPLFQSNPGSVAVLQAGFAGEGGEWQRSAHSLTTTVARTEILESLLEALPSTRMVQLRSPVYKEAVLGGPLGPEARPDDTALARVGHYNSGFLGSGNDLGTYVEPIERWKDYAAAEAGRVPAGGATRVFNPPRSNCETARAEVARFGYSYLAQIAEPTVDRVWVEEGCAAEFGERLGYRFELARGSVTAETRPGGLVELELNGSNLGYAPPFSTRPVYLVVAGEAGFATAELEAVDVRRWRGEFELSVRARLPDDLPDGQYRVALWMPDADDALAEDGRHALPFANDGVFDPVFGENVLTAALWVLKAGPGQVQPTQHLVIERLDVRLGN